MTVSPPLPVYAAVQPVCTRFMLCTGFNLCTNFNLKCLLEVEAQKKTGTYVLGLFHEVPKKLTSFVFLPLVRIETRLLFWDICDFYVFFLSLLKVRITCYLSPPPKVQYYNNFQSTFEYRMFLPSMLRSCVGSGFISPEFSPQGSFSLAHSHHHHSIPCHTTPCHIILWWEYLTKVSKDSVLAHIFFLVWDSHLLMNTSLGLH